MNVAKTDDNILLVTIRSFLYSYSCSNIQQNLHFKEEVKELKKEFGRDNLALQVDTHQ